MRRVDFWVGVALVLLAAAVVSSAAVPALAAARASAGSCTITQAKSLSGSVKTSIQFVNKTAGTVKVYWLSYAGKRVYYWTLAPGASYVQRTFATNPWVVLTSAGACIGYVIAPRSQYVISGSASAAAPPPPVSSAAPAAAEPHWVYQMINDFNLGISQPSGALGLSSLLYSECVQAHPDLAFIDGNAKNLDPWIRSFASYSAFIPGWVTQIAALKATAVTAAARAKLVAAEPLHLQEVTAWQGAVAAIKNHQCASFLGDLKQAQQVGVTDWADQYAAVDAIAKLYGSNSASYQTPYAQKLG